MKRRDLFRLAAGSLLLWPAWLLSGCSDQRSRLELLYAASLIRLIEQELGPAFARQTGIKLEGEARGSLAAARLVQDGSRRPDLLIVADPRVLQTVLTAAQVPRYALFAANSMVITYRPGSAYALAIKAGRSWYQALQAPGLRLGRSDPELDPLGYRALLVLQLAQRYYRQPGLLRKIIKPDQLYPEAQLMAQLESGQLDAAFVYRNMSSDHHLPFSALPPEIDLSDPARQAEYRQAAYTDRQGVIHRGAPIIYAAAPLAKAPHPQAARRFTDFLGSEPAQKIMTQNGFLVWPDFPLWRSWGEFS